MVEEASGVPKLISYSTCPKQYTSTCNSVCNGQAIMGRWKIRMCSRNTLTQFCYQFNVTTTNNNLALIHDEVVVERMEVEGAILDV